MKLNTETKPLNTREFLQAQIEEQYSKEEITDSCKKCGGFLGPREGHWHKLDEEYLLLCDNCYLLMEEKMASHL